MTPVECILAKRDARALGADDIKQLVSDYTAGDVPDYQMSAFLMASFLNGFTEEETSALTDAMLYSGDVLDLSGTSGIKVDKHSTGGVGDKISILLAPIVAACGVPVPMISGRGLGHTGGTLDKLESIPGFDVNLSIAEYREQLDELGIVMIGQTDEIAPADRKLYALRDVTGTVEFIPFIAASIMSKKLAEGIDALVLDVKCGRGAFMKTQEEARRLAETLVGIGERFGKPTVALMTRMDDPLGRAVGNWPEVEESIACLRGDERAPDDVMEVTLALAGEMIHLGGEADSPEAGRARAQEAIDDGSALEKLAELVERQDGDADLVRNPEEREQPERTIEVHAPASGYVNRIDAYRIGTTAVALGAGRLKKEDAVDPLAGMYLNKKPGDHVEAGDVLASLFTRKSGDAQPWTSAVASAYEISPEEPEPAPRLMGRYTKQGWDADPATVA